MHGPFSKILGARVPPLRIDATVPGCQKLQMTAGLTPPVRHRMLYSCSHMTTVGFKGLSGNWSPSGHCIIVFCDHVWVMSAPAPPPGGDRSK